MPMDIISYKQVATESKHNPNVVEPPTHNTYNEVYYIDLII